MTEATKVRTSSVRTSMVGSRRRTAWVAIAPAVLLMLVFFGLPIVQGMDLSLSDWSGLGDVRFVGLRNFIDAFHSGDLAHSAVITLLYAGLSAGGIVVLATLLAAAVSGQVYGASVYRVVWFLPAVAPAAAVGIFWSLAVQPDTGIVNVVLGHVGLGSSHVWLAQADTAIYPAIFATVWASVGFAFILILGSMTQVPVALYEAAKLDGASAARCFFSISLPLIRPVLVVTGVLEVIWCANGFTMLWAMTAGGPGNATEILPILIYKQAFLFGNFGPASAMAVIAGVVLVAAGSITLRIGRSAQDAIR